MYQVDHIVHFVEDPAHAVAAFQQEGFHAVAGGRHPQWGTYNALSYFGLSYVEWIAVEHEEQFVKAAKQPYTLHETYALAGRQNGLSRVAIRTTTIAEDAEKFAAAGFQVNGPAAFSRTRPDGSKLSWQLLHIGLPHQHLDLPFFIQWEQSDEARQQDFEQRGIIAPHAAGPLKLSEIVLRVPDFHQFDLLHQLLQVDRTITYDDLTGEECGMVHIKDVDVVFQVSKDGPYKLKQVTFTGANEARSILYDGGQYIVRK